MEVDENVPEDEVSEIEIWQKINNIRHQSTCINLHYIADISCKCVDCCYFYVLVTSLLFEYNSN